MKNRNFGGANRMQDSSARMYAAHRHVRDEYGILTAYLYIVFDQPKKEWNCFSIRY
jgi:hypothetical protein